VNLHHKSELSVRRIRSLFTLVKARYKYCPWATSTTVMRLFQSIGNDAVQIILGYAGDGHFGLITLVSHAFHNQYLLLFPRHITYRSVVLVGSLVLLRYAVNSLGFPLDNGATSDAASYGQLRLLKWMRGTKACGWGPRTCSSAANNGHLEVRCSGRAKIDVHGMK
jgi:hypothetical protein